MRKIYTFVITVLHISGAGVSYLVQQGCGAMARHCIVQGHAKDYKGKLENLDFLLSCRQAVELDDLSPVDDLVKHSSSAVDIRTVLMQVCCHLLLIPKCICTNSQIYLYQFPNVFVQIAKCIRTLSLSQVYLFQIKTFWAQLSWPDVESSYAYISKILDVSVSFIC